MSSFGGHWQAGEDVLQMALSFWGDGGVSACPEPCCCEMQHRQTKHCAAVLLHWEQNAAPRSDAVCTAVIKHLAHHRWVGLLLQHPWGEGSLRGLEGLLR